MRKSKNLSEVSNMSDEKHIPPVAKVEPHKMVTHGVERVDNYFWLRGKEKPEVINYLEAENAYAEQMTAHIAELREKLYHEMVGRIKETDISVPVQVDQYFYYYRTEEGKQYRIYCRKYESLDAEEELLLDCNQLAEGKDYFALGALEVSANHQLLAYSTDTSGAEDYTIYVKDLNTGNLLADVIEGTSDDLEWANDNQTLFYTTKDESQRPDKMWRHLLGKSPGEDVVLLEEPDEKYWLGLTKTKDHKFVLVYMASKQTSEWHFISADSPNDPPQVVQPREPMMEYIVSHREGYFYVTTNWDATNFKVMRTPITEPGKEHWEEFIAYQPDVKIDYVECFRDHLVVHKRVKGLQQITVMDVEDNTTHDIEFEEASYGLNYRTGNLNPWYETTVLRFEYSSLTQPKTIYDYDLKTRDRILRKQEEVVGYDRNLYNLERIHATAPDGTEVPISLVYKKGFKRDGSAPCLLEGYGSYGISNDPVFMSNMVSLVDRGFVVALSHIRGGGDLGRPWYENGKFLSKKNTFTDFIACAEHLINENYTSSDKLAVMGGSAGGLLMGAVINMRPNLFKVVIAMVPFVDVISTMLDASIPLTTVEYEEWGNPNDREYFDYMLSYSPYDNVEAKAYPHMIVMAGLNDPRVAYWEPAKWVAKLRALKTDNNRLVLKTNMGAGHGGASGRYERLKELAFVFSFVLDVLGFSS